MRVTIKKAKLMRNMSSLTQMTLQVPTTLHCLITPGHTSESHWKLTIKLCIAETTGNLTWQLAKITFWYNLHSDPGCCPALPVSLHPDSASVMTYLCHLMWSAAWLRSCSDSQGVLNGVCLELTVVAIRKISFFFICFSSFSNIEHLHLTGTAFSMEWGNTKMNKRHSPCLTAAKISKVKFFWMATCRGCSQSGVVHVPKRSIKT